MIKEDFLHFIWYNLKFNIKNLVTTDGKDIQILDNGYFNTDSGPDFSSARIRIDKMLWIGSVEIHVNSGDWIKHSHHKDPAYDNVILHVVLHENEVIKDRFGNPIPCLELKKIIFPNELKNYKLLLHRNQLIPCQKLIGQVDQITISRAIERAYVQRMEKKSARILDIFKRTQNDLESSFLICLFRYFGSNINGDTFENLAALIPFKIIKKDRWDIVKIEAILFGTAGFLNESPSDEYTKELKEEFDYQQNKHKLKKLKKSLWKFLRMRPSSFPTVRLAQLAALLYEHDSFFDKIRSLNKAVDFDLFFRATPSEYWNTHYLFGKISKNRLKKTSKGFRTLLIINVIVPFFFAYAYLRNDDRYKIAATDLLLDLPAEKNKIVQVWADLNIPVLSAYDSQAFIELKKYFCDKKLCLHCPIGQKIVVGK